LLNIRENLKSFNTPFVERKNRASSVEEYNTNMSALFLSKIGLIKD